MHFTNKQVLQTNKLQTNKFYKQTSFYKETGLIDLDKSLNCPPAALYKGTSLNFFLMQDVAP